MSDATHLQVIREIVDLAAPRAHINTLFNERGPEFFMNCPVGCQHWSRAFEWPWSLIAAASINARDVVLEAGGGDTEFQFLLARYAQSVVNFDQAQEMLDRSELEARRRGVTNLLQRRGDLGALPYPNDYYDKIFCISVVEHIKHAELCIDELWRVLKPGGRLLLTIDVVETVDERRNYLFDVNRAAGLLRRWGLDLPAFPENGMQHRVDGNALSVLCVAVTK